jgi:hypothetical protein
MMQQGFSCCSKKLCGAYNTDTELSGSLAGRTGAGDETFVPYMGNQGSRIFAQPPAPRNGARVRSGGAADRRRKLSVEGTRVRDQKGCVAHGLGWLG